MRIIHVKVVGDLSYPDLMDHINKLKNDGFYRPPMKNIFDYRLCIQNQLTISEAKQFALTKISLGHIFANEMCAIIAPEDINYGLGRLHEILTSSSSFITSVFRRFEDGLSWLDIGSHELKDFL